MNRFWRRLLLTLDMIKFEHSVFALPFALTGALLAWRGERSEAARMLGAAQALGESAPGLSRCLVKPGDCSAPAQEASTKAIGAEANDPLSQATQ